MYLYKHYYFGSTRIRFLFGPKDASKVVPNNSRALCGVNWFPDTLFLVVLYDWAGLLVECTKPFAEGLYVVVGALDEGFTCDVVDHLLLWWTKQVSRRVSRAHNTMEWTTQLEFAMIGSTTGWMYESASDTRDQELILNLQFDNMVQLLFTVRQHSVELFRLGNSSGETVENESRNARGRQKGSERRQFRVQVSFRQLAKETAYPRLHSLLLSS